MTRAGHVARAYWLDVLIAVAAVEAALEVVLRHDPLREPRMTPWRAAPAIARRAAAARAPALALRRAGGRLAAGRHALFRRGRLVPFTTTALVAGIAAAFLLGHLHEGAQARLGLAIVLSGAAIVVYNNPNQSGAALIFMPLLFVIGWLAGYAMRERAEQAAAEVRGSQAEREREAAARIAVAADRARIARELHDHQAVHLHLAPGATEGI